MARRAATLTCSFAAAVACASTALLLASASGAPPDDLSQDSDSAPARASSDKGPAKKRNSAAAKASDQTRSDQKSGNSNRSKSAAGKSAGKSSERKSGAAKPVAADPNAASQKQRKLQAEQRELQQRLGRLKQQLAAAEASHSEAADALAESEAAISAANRKLRELKRSRQQVEHQIANAQERSRAVASRQGLQEYQLGEVVRAQFSLAQQPAWQRLLDKGTVDDLQRNEIYLEYVVRAKSQLIGELRDRRTELAALETESRERRAELANISEEERAGRAQLLREQTARRHTLDQLARQINSRRDSIATLERDDKRLASLIERIDQILEEQRRARANAERQSAAGRTARRDPGAPAAAPGGATRGEPPAGSPFGALRGKMPLPVAGEIAARFGSTRRTEAGVNAPTWRGLFIRAPEGTEVTAVAAGRVVFADWLRGFGNLLILDHGDGFLTVYGNNESLLANSGDKVAAGEAVATIGNTGGNREPGLYFELRSQGHPIDPLSWAAAR